MLVLAIALSLCAAPTAEYDRLSNTTLWVEANKGLKGLIPVGNELQVKTEGKEKRVVIEASMRFWATLSADSAPELGILGGETNILSAGNLLVDGVRVDSISCALPPVPRRMGRFTTWHRDLMLTAKGMRAIASARKKVEFACGKRVESIESNELTNIAAAAMLFAGSEFQHDVAEQFRNQREADATEESKSAPQSASPSVVLGGEMAALRARKLVRIAECIAEEFEKDEDANPEMVTKKCKGFIDAKGSLISVK